MSTIHSNIEAFKELKHSPNEGKVVMLNLLKFKPDGGKELYIRYMQESNKHVEGVGGKMIFLSQPKELLYGEETWDLMMLVEYPSRQQFLKMSNDPEYMKVHELREQAVDKAVLYANDRIRFSEFASQGGQ